MSTLVFFSGSNPRDYSRILFDTNTVHRTFSSGELQLQCKRSHKRQNEISPVDVRLQMFFDQTTTQCANTSVTTQTPISCHFRHSCKVRKLYPSVRKDRDVWCRSKFLCGVCKGDLDPLPLLFLPLPTPFSKSGRKDSSATPTYKHLSLLPLIPTTTPAPT